MIINNKYYYTTVIFCSHASCFFSITFYTFKYNKNKKNLFENHLYVSLPERDATLILKSNFYKGSIPLVLFFMFRLISS